MMRTREMTIKDFGYGPCVACGCDASAIHHINGKEADNRRENIERVCFYCHIYRHLEEAQPGIWRNNAVAKTPRDLIEQLDRRERIFEFRCGQEVYRVRQGVSKVEKAE